MNILSNGMNCIWLHSSDGRSNHFRHCMLEKVRKILGFSPRKTGNKIVISAEKLERRVALLENGRLEEYSVERNSSRNIVGSVYKGRVKNIEQGLKAMFVDIGFEKNAFLHFWDAIPAALDSGIEEIDRPRGGRKQKKKITARDIPNIYPVGSEVIVQVTKGPDRDEGAARHHQSELCRSLPRADAVQRPKRYLSQDRRSQGTPAPAQDSAGAGDSGRHRRHHPHGWRRPARPLLRARPATSCSINGPRSRERINERPKRRRAFSKSPIWSSAPCVIS